MTSRTGSWEGVLRMVLRHRRTYTCPTCTTSVWKGGNQGPSTRILHLAIKNDLYAAAQKMIRMHIYGISSIHKPSLVCAAALLMLIYVCFTWLSCHACLYSSRELQSWFTAAVWVGLKLGLDSEWVGWVPGLWRYRVYRLGG